MSYLVEPIINKSPMKAKSFKSEDLAIRFMLKVLEEYNLQVDRIITRKDIEEYVCEQSGSRIFVKARY